MRWKQEGSVFLEASTEILGQAEVVPVHGGRRRRPEELKGRTAAEMREAGATMAGVAQRHDLNPNQVSDWGRLARQGRLVLPAADADVAFAPRPVWSEGHCDPGPGDERPGALHRLPQRGVQVEARADAQDRRCRGRRRGARGVSPCALSSP